jgi:hypothetical protein
MLFYDNWEYSILNVEQTTKLLGAAPRQTHILFKERK